MNSAAARSSGASTSFHSATTGRRASSGWRSNPSRDLGENQEPVPDMEWDNDMDQEAQQVMQQRQQPQQHQSDAWRAFAGTDAGRLLARIYGGNKPQVNVPAPKTRSSSEPRPDFVPAGGMPENDARRSTFNREQANSMHVPQVGVKKTKNRAPIDANISRRRNLDKIKQFEEEQRNKDESGGAQPLRKPVATETEKRKLQSLNQYKGGKSLPEELTQQPLKGNIPLSLITGKRNRGRRTQGQPQPDDGKSKELREMDTLYEQIIEEINERNQYIEELKEIDESKAKEEMGVIKLEVQERVQDLKKLQGLMEKEQRRLYEEEKEK